jgi:RNA polymerase sigma-70 factor (ECF subfamily)
MVAAAQSDPARFVDLYDRHFHRVYAYALRRTKNRVDAEDVTSDVFHRALVNLRKYEWRGKPFIAWLFRIAANAIADSREETPDVGADPPVEIEAVDPDLERQAMLFQLVDRLPDEQRRVIEMRFGEGRSLLEVARAIGKSDGAVKQIQRRALEQLRRDLETSHG